MSDREKWGLRGPVHSLREEFAELDLSTEEWLAPSRYSLLVFLRDGRLSESEFHNPDGTVVRSVYHYDAAGRLAEIRTGDSVTTYAYDEAGRLARVADGAGERERFRYEGGGHVRIRFVPAELQERNVAFSCGVEGSERSYSCHGTTEIRTLYDASGRGVEMRFLDGGGKLLNRVAFRYDSEGRLLSEAQLAGGAAFGGLRNRLLARLAGLRSEVSRVEYRYDSESHRVAAHSRLGKVMNEHVSWSYDRFGNKIEEVREEVSREMALGLTGMKAVSERCNRHHVHFEYAYDENGNWTEQVVLVRTEPNPDFHRQHIQRREITYW